MYVMYKNKYFISAINYYLTLGDSDRFITGKYRLFQTISVAQPASIQRPSIGKTKRLRWSRGSVLAFGTQIRGFKPGRSRRIFQGEINPQHAFLRKGCKAVCTM